MIVQYAGTVRCCTPCGRLQCDGGAREPSRHWVAQLIRLDSSRVASCGLYDKTIRLWDVETGTELRRFERHGQGVTSVAVLDARRVISASWDCTLKPKASWRDLKAMSHSTCFQSCPISTPWWRVIPWVTLAWLLAFFRRKLCVAFLLRCRDNAYG